jgi:hypothetical protein
MGKHKGGEGGTVVNIASVAGLGLQTACPVYDGTKFFVVGYSQSISVSFKEQFLRIYSILRKTSVGYSVSMFVSLLECLFETHSGCDGVLSILKNLRNSITKSKDFPPLRHVVASLSLCRRWFFRNPIPVAYMQETLLVEQVFVAELLSVTGSTIPTFPHIQPFIFL